jgi:uncharacterized protein (DUF2141 family)
MHSIRRILSLFAALPLLVCALLAGSPVQLVAQDTATPNASTLTVRITGIRNANGKIRLSLYRDAVLVESRLVEIDVKTMTARTVFDHLPQGVYSVHLFHDENLNGKMDTNLFGIPVEGYGFSNNPHKRMGKPGFNETNFQFNQPQSSIDIQMIYW